MPGPQARPLGGGTLVGTRVLLDLMRRRVVTTKEIHDVRLWPTARRILPRLLPSVHGQVEQAVAVIHRLYAAYRRPVCLEDFGSVPQVAHQIHPSRPSSRQERIERATDRVPRHLPAHEVAVSGALIVRAWGKRGVRD